MFEQLIVSCENFFDRRAQQFAKWRIRSTNYFNHSDIGHLFYLSSATDCTIYALQGGKTQEFPPFLPASTGSTLPPAKAPFPPLSPPSVCPPAWPPVSPPFWPAAWGSTLPWANSPVPTRLSGSPSFLRPSCSVAKRLALASGR